jgi:serine/threonine protein kinase
MAPESIYCLDLFNWQNFDSWSFGCLVYELFMKKPLFFKAKGIQQLGSMIYCLFRERFQLMDLPQTVLNGILEHDLITQ